jgi:hypothetical protein
MSDTAHHSRSTESLARPARLDQLTLRCDRPTRRAIEAALSREQKDRPTLSMGGFLAECAMNGLPGNLSFGQPIGADTDAIAKSVVAELGERLSGIETAVPVIADVLGRLAERLAAMETEIQATRSDTQRIRSVFENAAARQSGGTAS